MNDLLDDIDNQPNLEYKKHLANIKSKIVIGGIGWFIMIKAGHRTTAELGKIIGCSSGGAFGIMLIIALTSFYCTITILYKVIRYLIGRSKS
jgi:hypothetical protein